MAESIQMSCEMRGDGAVAGDLAVALAISDTGFYQRGSPHPFIDYGKPKEYQNRIDDEMDAGSDATRAPSPAWGRT